MRLSASFAPPIETSIQQAETIPTNQPQQVSPAHVGPIAEPSTSGESYGAVPRGNLARDILATLLVSGSTTVALLIIVSMLSRSIGPDELGLYLLARRIVALLFPIAMVGGVIALPRYVATSATPAEQKGVVLAAAVISGVTLLLLLIVTLGFGDQAAGLIFGESVSGTFMAVVMLLLAGYCVKGIAYGYYRGRIDVYRSNRLQLVSEAVIPVSLVILLTLYTDSAAVILGWLAVPYFVLGAAVLWPLLSIGGATKIRESLSRLLKFGSPRLVDGLANQGLVSLAPVVVQHYYGLRLAGFVIIAQVLLRALNMLFRPFGVVILPRVARMQQSDRTVIAGPTATLIQMTIHLGVFLSVLGHFMSRPLVTLWLGAEYREAIPLMQVFSLAIAPFLCYVLLRSVLDGAEERPMNTLSLLGALVVSILAIVITGTLNGSMVAVAFCIVLGYMVLGLATLAFAVSHFRLRASFLRQSDVLIVVAILGICLHWLTRWSVQYDFVAESVLDLSGGAVSALAFAAYVVARRVDWAVEVKRRALSLRSRGRVPEGSNDT